MELADLKVGDPVMIDDGGSWHTHYKRAIVEKIGKLHLVCGGTKFSLAHGRMPGSQYHGHRVIPFDQKLWDKWEKDQREKAMRQKVCVFRWDSASFDLIERVHALLPQPKTEE